MKGSFPKLVLACLIALIVFLALRVRELPPAAFREPTSVPSAAPKLKAAQERGSQSPVAALRPPARSMKSAASSGRSAEGRQPASARSPLELFTELFQKGEWSIQRGADGHPTGLKGVPIPGMTANADLAVVFAKKVAEQLGVAPDQISQAHAQADTEQGLQTVYRYEQWVGDYAIFGGSLSVFSRRADSAAYMVSASLRPVDDVPSNGINRAQAEALVLEYYKDRAGKISTPLYSSPFIYADQAPVEFAWYFLVNVTTPAPNKLKVLFGATTRRVLYESSALIN